MFVHVLPARDFVAEAQNSFSHCLKAAIFLKRENGTISTFIQVSGQYRCESTIQYFIKNSK